MLLKSSGTRESLHHLTILKPNHAANTKNQNFSGTFQRFSRLHPTIASKVFAQITPPAAKKENYQHQLGKRELEVLKLLWQGKNNREIAATLHLPEGTVKNHITRILCQMEVRDCASAPSGYGLKQRFGRQIF